MCCFDSFAGLTGGLGRGSVTSGPGEIKREEKEDEENTSVADNSEEEKKELKPSRNRTRCSLNRSLPSFILLLAGAWGRAKTKVTKWVLGGVCLPCWPPACYPCGKGRALALARFGGSGLGFCQAASAPCSVRPLHLRSLKLRGLPQPPCSTGGVGGPPAIRHPRGEGLCCVHPLPCPVTAPRHS